MGGLGNISPEYLQQIQQGLGGVGQGAMLAQQMKQKKEEQNASLFGKMAEKYPLKSGVEVPKSVEGYQKIANMFDTSKDMSKDTAMVDLVFFDPNKQKFFKKDLETGKLNEVTEVPKGSEVRNIDLTTYRAGVKESYGKRKSFLDGIEDFSSVVLNLNHIKQTTKQLEDYKPGVWNQVKAKSAMSVGEFAQDPAISEYLAALDGSLAMFARKVMAERGVLTDPDVERARKMLGNKTAPYAIKKRLIDELESKALFNLEVKKESADISDEELQKLSPNFYSLYSQTRGNVVAGNAIAIPQNAPIRGRTPKPSRTTVRVIKTSDGTPYRFVK